MIKETDLTEYRVKPLGRDRIAHIEDGEVAFALDSVYHGSCANTAMEQEKLRCLTATPYTLGFEPDTECDFTPYALKTYNADKTFNAEYFYGEHEPGARHYPEPANFK